MSPQTRFIYLAQSTGENVPVPAVIARWSTSERIDSGYQA